MAPKKKTEPERIIFGPHMMVDAYDCDPKVLDDSTTLYGILEELIEMLGMHALTKPYIIRAENNGKKDPGGWTGFVIIAESHISFHSFVKRKFITFDIYSCKAFDTDKAKKFLQKSLKTDDMDVFIQQRGRGYPAHDLM